MKEIDVKQKLGITLLGGVMGFGLVLFFIIKPIMQDLSVLHEEVEVERIQLNKLLAEEASYQQARSDLARIEPRVAQIESLFPSREELVNFVETLERIADNNENIFSISIIDLQEVQSQLSSQQAAEQVPYSIVPGLVNVEVIPYSIKLQGDFLSVVQFLQSFEHQEFFSEIEALTLTSTVSQQGQGASGSIVRSGQITANIQAAFYAKQEK